MRPSLRNQPGLRRLWLAAQAREDLSPATRKLHFLQSLKCTAKYEKLARQQGAVAIAGVDEVGRGALFGPVVAAAVILPENFRLTGLRDSKQLDAPTRERMSRTVTSRAIAFSIAEVDVDTIDRINIYQATRQAMHVAVAALETRPDHLLIDALRLDCEQPQTKLFYGDSLSISIAAASVVAKVHRDALICAMHDEFPHYNLRSNKGYSTLAHKRALKEHGPTRHHRRSFSPVYLCDPDAQLEMLLDAEGTGFDVDLDLALDTLATSAA